jgi:hypothetical protein
MPDLIYAGLDGGWAKEAEEDAELFAQPNDLTSWLSKSSIVSIGDW